MTDRIETRPSVGGTALSGTEAEIRNRKSRREEDEENEEEDCCGPEAGEGGAEGPQGSLPLCPSLPLSFMGRDKNERTKGEVEKEVD